MKPEEKARKRIDKQLEQAGWILQGYNEFNPKAAKGIAVKEFPLSTGDADYLLFVDGKPLGVVEAKQEETTLSGVFEQSKKYLSAFNDKFEHMNAKALFTYETTGIVTYFTDLGDPNPRSRRVFSFHHPQTLLDWSEKEESLRRKLKKLPPLDIRGLRQCQVEAITNLEKSFADNRPRALIQMATGSGKTYMAVNFSYRLIEFAKAKRILFLVDRTNLGRQTLKEFQKFVTPQDGRKFTELYNIDHLTTNTIDKVSKVCITTIQRMYSMLKGEQEFECDLEEQSMFQMTPIEEERSREIQYNPKIPIETFDFIVIDECHRSIYKLWNQVIEYFDAFIIGLTATPGKLTFGFFNQNLVTEYGHERAVADGVNVDYEVYTIKTRITEQGSVIEAKFPVIKRDKLTRKERWEQVDDDFEYSASQLDRQVVSRDQIRTVIKAFKEKLFTEIFPGRTIVPKTLVFAKDDSHANDIVQIIREEFGKGNEFCKKITYKTTGVKPEDLIQEFRIEYNPRIVVSVDMISTGTDIKPLECLLFMRNVKSRVYFEQMKGRGTRTISSNDLHQVTTDTKEKTHFIIVDAVGVCDNDKTDSKPLERKRNEPFEKLLMSIVLGNRDDDTFSSIASRLTRLDIKIDEKARKEIEEVTDGKQISVIVNELLDVLDPDIIEEKAKIEYETNEPTKKQMLETQRKMKEEAVSLFYKPVVREKIIEIKKRNEQIIDFTSKDEILFAGQDDRAKERAEKVIDTFKKFIEENKDEMTALQIIYNQPYGKRHLTYQQVKELADALTKPPYLLSQELIWQAYEQLEQSRVRNVNPVKLLTDIISLIRYQMGELDILKPYPEIADQLFEKWLYEQIQSGKEFTDKQLNWLYLIKNQILIDVHINLKDLNEHPFFDMGGLVKGFELFGENLEAILENLNKVLVS